LLQRLTTQLPGDDPLLLAAALADHAWHHISPDLREPPALLPLFEPVRLAELSGLTVFDDFTRRDIAAGGDGQGVLLAPYWLLLSDRSSTRENRHARLLVAVHGAESRRPVVYFLPPHAVQGDVLPPMAFINVAAGADPVELGEAVARAISSRIQGDEPHWPRARHLHLAACADAELILAEIVEQAPDIDTAEATFHSCGKSFPCHYLHAAAAAMLAVLHIDQTPANLPENAGDATPRVLGRLTPGSPVHWKRLLRMMAQHDLPATTLNRAM